MASNHLVPTRAADKTDHLLAAPPFARSVYGRAPLRSLPQTPCLPVRLRQEFLLTPLGSCLNPNRTETVSQRAFLRSLSAHFQSRSTYSWSIPRGPSVRARRFTPCYG